MRHKELSAKPESKCVRNCKNEGEQADENGLTKGTGRRQTNGRSEECREGILEAFEGVGE